MIYSNNNNNYLEIETSHTLVNQVLLLQSPIIWPTRVFLALNYNLEIT